VVPGALRGHEAAEQILVGAFEGRRVAGERRAAPAGMWRADELVDVSGELLTARAIKDPDELNALRAALRASDAGQRRLREIVSVGVSEIELFGEIRGAIEGEAGERTPLLADLVSGSRTTQMGGPPIGRTLDEGDLVLCDLAPRVRGVWADSCATVAVGGEAGPHRQAHARVREALQRALEAARPGVRAGDLDAHVRLDLDYPHHTGHGIGGSYYEHPRIVPGSHTILSPGMVVAIEPGYYDESVGIRLEHVLLITDGGAEDPFGPRTRPLRQLAATQHR
jgi:Xaa-Pro aminopeptidase